MIFIQRLLARGALWFLLLVAAHTLITIPQRVVNEWPVRLLAGGVLFALAWAGAGRLPRRGLAEVSASGWLRLALGITAAGLALRIIWAVLVPANLVSDFNDYWKGAQALLDTGRFEYTVFGAKWRAHRTPGYFLFLAGWFAALGRSLWVVTLTNLLLYLGTCWALARLAVRLGGRPCGLVALAGWAFYLSDIASTNQPATDPLFAFLFTASLVMWLEGGDGRRGRAAVAGLLVGLGALVRPTMLLAPAAWGLELLARGRPGWAEARRWLAGSALLVVTISPWVIRNWLVLGYPLVGSTNSGMIMYTMNSPIGREPYGPEAHAWTAQLGSDEMTSYRRGMELGWKWIRENPAEYASLAYWKLRQFFGEDTAFLYWTLRVPKLVPGKIYAAAQGVAHLWWTGVWLLVVAAAATRFRRGLSPEAVLVVAGMAVFVAAHTITEAQPRYHSVIVPSLVALGAAAFGTTAGAGRTGEEPSA